MTKIDLDEIERLAKAATPGPYFVSIDDASDSPPHRNSGLSMVDTGRMGDWWAARLVETDQAKYIAATDPQTVIALVRAVRAAMEYHRLRHEPLGEGTTIFKQYLESDHALNEALAPFRKGSDRWHTSR